VAAMDIATAPSTPDNARSPPIIRRAFTAPTRFARYPRDPTPIRDPQVQGAETLFAQDRCRIVSFSCGVKRPTSSGSSHNDKLHEPVGVLPWASLTERTIAAGNKPTALMCEIEANAPPLTRTITDLSSSRGRIPQCGQYLAANTTKVTMLVR